jgi:phosphoribosylformylglycinamidine synthase subunit PurQ / glutaminase
MIAARRGFDTIPHMKPRAVILRAAGSNCDSETAHALQLAGAEADRIHLNRVIENPALLDAYQILVIPGGFSYGDDISAGRIFANQLMQRLGDALRSFVEKKKPVAGICNGFQVLVKTNLLPGDLGGATGQTCTLTDNDSRRFIDRWVTLERKSNKCVWTRGITRMELPIAHGEGKLLAASDAVRQALWDRDQVALVYVNDNPNGSTDDIAGICDASGLVFGLMPHPERHVDPTQHYDWTSRQQQPAEGDGLAVFRNVVSLF